MVVRMRHTKSHRNNRRSHHKVDKPALTVDASTGVRHLRHRASEVTGTYRGRVVIDVEKKLRKEVRKQKKETAEK